MSFAYGELQSLAEVYADTFPNVVDFPSMGFAYGPGDFDLYRENFEKSQRRRGKRWITWARS